MCKVPQNMAYEYLAESDKSQYYKRLADVSTSTTTDSHGKM